MEGYVEAGRRYLKDRVAKNFTIICTDCFAYPIVSLSEMRHLIRCLHRDLAKGWEYHLEVIVPDSLVVANGGHLLETTAGNDTITYRYQDVKPAWRRDVCIAPEKVLQDEAASQKVFFLSARQEQARAALNAVSGTMRFFSEAFGPLSRPSGFVVIEVPDGYGSQADRTCILQETDAFRGHVGRIYHEISQSLEPAEP